MQVLTRLGLPALPSLLDLLLCSFSPRLRATLAAYLASRDALSSKLQRALEVTRLVQVGGRAALPWEEEEDDDEDDVKKSF